MEACAPVKICIVVNPKAGAGRAKQAGLRLASQLDGAVCVETDGPGAAERLAREAQREGAEVVVPVGGDGTIQQVVAGLCLNEHGEPQTARAALSLLPAGTGGDYRKTFAFTESVDQAVTRILSPRPKQIDVGRAEVTGKDGASPTAFANVLSFGLGGLTDQLVEAGPKWLGGRAAFLLGALRATAVYHPPTVELVLDDVAVETAPFSNVAICLGRYFGGGMKIAPDSDPSDGLFDVITIERSRLKTAALSLLIYQGRHLGVEGVKHYRCKKVEARVTGPGDSLVDLDGEQPGRLPLKVTVLPGALTLLT